eukprot:CAMPEP_0178613780 /NCGR_PEP_ID=MMETSP0698-20121128/1825_1 /TAXON_ID=265572 /ORGANISM="Extubocellulus spinifer, Strain CCMP396" /LENGTH=312 /DNA_ID=CAMNT_0020252495 /DNA_START=125 /DNA_END=1063 /DNA_ORIENTATION=-
MAVTNGDYGGGDPNDRHYHDDDYQQSLEEELSEILEAFYSIISEEEMNKYQAFVEKTEQMKIKRRSIDAPERAPDFELPDQDGETVTLKHLLEQGPVVLVFYRGKWCPQCNATIMRLQRELEKIKAKGATLVAISPMLPDGTRVFSTKRELLFPVLSDVGNHVARKFNITFTVPEEIRPEMVTWGEDVPAHNGDDTWEIPVPSTYVISKEGKIVWAYVNEDPSHRAEPEDIVAAIPDEKEKEANGSRKERKGKTKKLLSSSLKDSLKRAFKKKTKRTKGEPTVERSPRNSKAKFGKKKQDAGDFLGNYLIKE